MGLETDKSGVTGVENGVNGRGGADLLAVNGRVSQRQRKGSGAAGAPGIWNMDGGCNPSRSCHSRRAAEMSRCD